MPHNTPTVMNSLNVVLLLIVTMMCVQGIKLKDDPQPGCFAYTPNDASLLFGDVYSIDLDMITTGNNPEYTVTTSLDEEVVPPYYLKKAFSPSGQTDPLNIGSKTCVDWAQGLGESDFLFLCDQNKVGFASYNLPNGKLTKASALQLPEGLTCHSLATSSVRGKGYVVCMKGDSTLTLVKFDLLDPSVQAVLDIPQTEGASTLSKNLQILVDDFKYDEDTDTIIYIFEGYTGDNKVKFRMAKDTPNNLINGGFYSTESGTAKGLKEGNLVGFYYDGSNVLIATRTEGDRNFLQRCYRSPVYGVYNCAPEAVELSQGPGFIRLYNSDLTLRTSNDFDVYLVNLMSVSVGYFDSDAFTFTDVGTFDISKNSLKEVVEVMRSGDNIFLVGPTSQDSSILDGIVRYKISAMSFDEYNYPENSPGVVIILPDVFDTMKSDLITVGGDISSFYKVERNRLIINTWPFDETKYKEIKFTVQCVTPDQQKSTVAFTVDTLVDINDGETMFSVPEVNVYTGQIVTLLPSNSENVRGNAPIITLDESEMAGSKLIVKLSEKQLIKNEFPDKGKVLSTKYVGDGFFYYTTVDSVNFFNTRIKDGQIEVFTPSHVVISGDTSVFVATEEDGFIAYVSSVKTTPPTGLKSLKQQPSRSKVVVHVVDSATSKDKFPPIEINFEAELALVKFVNGQLFVVVVGALDQNHPRGFYFIQFDIDAEKRPQKFELLQYLSPHLCPTGLSWAPRKTPTIFISSVCGDSSQDNHVYQFVVDFEDPKNSFIGTTYRVVGSLNFNLCAQNRLINIIDYDANKAYSFDSYTGTDSIFVLPLSYYGIERITSHACNQDDNILQVIGTDADGKNPKMIVFRAEETDRPESRIHSVIDLDKGYSSVAASFSDTTDQVVTIFFDEAPSSIGGALVYVDGPHLVIVGDSKTPGEYNLNFKMTLPGKNGDNILKRQSKLKFEDQKVDIKASLISSQNKLAINGTLVDLDKVLLITGPYTSAQIKNPQTSVALYDRVSKSGVFGNITTIFTDAVFYKDFVFGYSTTSNPKGAIILTQNDTELLRIEGYDLSSISYVEKGENVKFFAIVPQALKNDMVICVYYDGEAWITATGTLPSRGYEKAYFTDGPGSNYIISNINNNDDYAFEIVAVQVLGAEVAFGLPYSIKFEDNIADFEVVGLSETNLVVIIGPEYTALARFYWFSIQDDLSLDILGLYKSGLVPTYIESHEGVVFSCQKRRDLKGFDCAITGQNANNYIVSYSVDFEAKNPDEFISSTRVTSLLKNYIGYSPVNIDFQCDYVAIVVKNQNTDSESNDNFLGLIYRLSVPAVLLDDVNIYERDPYKVLDSESLGAVNRGLTVAPEPKIFVDSTGTNFKLGINVGFKEEQTVISIRVFNLDPLSIVVPNSTRSNEDIEISFLNINQKFNTLKLNDVFDFASQDGGDDKPTKKKSPWVLLLILLTILIITGIVVAILTIKKKDDGGNEGPEHTMKPDETGSVASGNYSKL